MGAPRHAIYYTRQGRKSLFGVRNNENEDPLVLLQDGEKENLVLDFTDYLADGETVQEATIDPTNIGTSVTVASPLVTIALENSQTYGYADAYVTMSSGAILVERIEVRWRYRWQWPHYRDYYGRRGAGAWW